MVSNRVKSKKISFRQFAYKNILGSFTMFLKGFRYQSTAVTHTNKNTHTDPHPSINRQNKRVGGAWESGIRGWIPEDGRSAAERSAATGSPHQDNAIYGEANMHGSAVERQGGVAAGTGASRSEVLGTSKVLAAAIGSNCLILVMNSGLMARWRVRARVRRTRLSAYPYYRVFEVER